MWHEYPSTPLTFLQSYLPAYFLQMVLLELLYWDVFLVIAISSVVSFFVVFGATRSLRGAVLALLAIGCVLCCLFGVMVSVYEIKVDVLMLPSYEAANLATWQLSNLPTY